MRQLFSYQTLSTEFVFAALGVILAAFWTGNPWLCPVRDRAAPLIHRALSVPQLQAEARVDPKTGLFNARYFASALSEELSRAQRFERPLSLIMADLDLLREINNTYGHLAGDAVLKGIAEVFRAELRHYDVPARFGGEEFSILLPETPPEQAMEIAERIRRAVADKLYDVETSSEPIRATVSIGVAGFPKDAQDPNALIHQADLAVYRAKLQGRNRVLGASSEPLLMPADRTQRLVAVPEEGDHKEPLARVPEALPEQERRHTAHTTSGPRFLQLSVRLGLLVGLVSTAGIAAGVVGAIFGSSTDMIGLLAVIALVSVGEALALELDDGSISVSAVGALAGAALFGPRAALPLAIAICVVQWSAQRQQIHRVLFNIGTLSLSSLAAAGVFTLGFDGGFGELVTVASGLVAGGVYFAVNTGLLSVALAAEGRENVWRVWHERFLWLLPHYVVYGFIGGVIAIGYHAAGLYALAVFAVPLLLMRKTQEAYLSHTRRSAQKLRQAAETIHTQNVSLEQANRLLKERSTAAMESLSATVDARDAYTAGHSRRVQQLALAIGRELGLSQVELDLLGHAALFHDIGKLAIPDSILLKPASLTEEEWALMQRHADEGARIIDRLGFLGDAVPAIRHHHERFDGTGYPDRLRHEEIPLGARIIHVADALDSMLTTRIYRAAEAARGGARGAPRRRRHPVLPALRRRARADPAARVAHGRRARDPEAARDLAPAGATRTCPRDCPQDMAVRAYLQVAENALHCLHGTIPPPPRGGRHRSGGARGVPGGDPEAVHRRGDPGAADGERRAARPLADDARVRRRPADDGASADRDRAFRQLERRQAAGGAGAAPVRDAGGAARAAAGARRGARPDADGARHRRAQGLGAVEVAPLAHLRLAGAGPARGGLRRPGGGGAARARRRAGRRCSRGSSAGCRRWPTGRRPAVPTSRC